MSLGLGDLDDLLKKELSDLQSALADLTQRESLLELKGDEAQCKLDVLQLLADFPRLPPRCLMIRNVKLLGDGPFGGGGFGDLWKGEIGSSATDRMECAVKIVRRYRKENENAFKTHLREAILWRQLKHPNVLPFLGIYHLDNNKKDICLVSPFMENGHLHDFLTNSRPEDVHGQTLMYDIASGVVYLHDEDIIHGDLKEYNVLVRKDGRACICDFGSARLAVTLGLGHTTSVLGGGTHGYMAPELWSGGLSSKETDVYAYGTLCYGASLLVHGGNHP
ncbi:serine/threonine protein kinase [Marasmius crinis-equi]|uniref:Serine/threonine protein kinase n=1 Tax=Marasmius crinis-equi TaxID=585013 RepID=A0ABR3EXX1_9AGAR